MLWRSCADFTPHKNTGCIAQMGEAAAAVHMEPFIPRSGVHVETDPKATTVSRASAMGDDEGVIDEYVKKLEVHTCSAFASVHMRHHDKAPFTESCKQRFESC